MGLKFPNFPAIVSMLGADPGFAATDTRPMFLNTCPEPVLIVNGRPMLASMTPLPALMKFMELLPMFPAP